MALQPTHWFGMHIPGSGLVLALLIVLLTGFLAAKYAGPESGGPVGSHAGPTSRW